MSMRRQHAHIRLVRPHFTGRHITAALTLFIAVLAMTTMPAHAIFLTWDEEAQLNDTPFYDPTAACVAATGGTSGTPTAGANGKYIKVGKIPVDGLDTAATTYGGGYNEQQKKWQPSNGQQGGGGDDNGMGNDGKPLPGRTAYAELSPASWKQGDKLGTALGDLPEYQPLEISYGGKTIVAIKADVGSNLADPIDGVKPTLDLWWETARLLDFKNGTAKLKIHALPMGTKPTPIDGKAGTAADDTKPAVQSCSCGAGDQGTISGDNPTQIWKFLTGKGLTPVQTAAIMGNMKRESNFNPKARNPSSGAYGIAQWLGSRLTNLKKYAEDASAQPSRSGKKYSDLDVQYNFFWHEVNGDEKAALNALKKVSDLDQATVTWEKAFERSEDQVGSKAMNERIANARKVLNTYGKGATDPNASGDSSTSACPTTVDCSNPDPANSGLSQVRQDVVCIAQKELADWKQKKGYPGNVQQPTGYTKYTQGRKEDWCADFASWVYNQANYPLHGGGRWNVPGVINIPNADKTKFKWHPAGSGYKPQPGDLQTHRGFSHVNIYIGPSNNKAIGGNQTHGPYPSGSLVSISNSGDIDGYLEPLAK